jgi:hypothetical protein
MKINYILYPFYQHEKINHQGIIAFISEFEYQNIEDIYNFKLWTELKREYKNVDYTEVVEEYDDTQLEQAMACGANGCEII